MKKNKMDLIDILVCAMVILAIFIVIFAIIGTLLEETKPKEYTIITEQGEVTKIIVEER